MAFNSIFFHGFIFIFVTFILTISQIDCVDNNTTRQDKTALFVFGDSTVDPGNNNYINTTLDFQSNWWPYGESYFKYPTGRPCDGRLISDFIAEYAKLPLIPSYFEIERKGFVHGVNFASSICGCLVETNQGLCIDLKTQLRYFKKVVKKLKKKLGAKQSKKLISNAVYMISIGSIDYGQPFRKSPNQFPYPKQEFANMVLGNLTSVLKEVYKRGGRKFAIFTSVPLGCFPSARAFVLQQNKTDDCFEELNVLLKLHNSILPTRLKQLQKELKGFTYTLFDLYKVVDQRINNPSKYGFEESKMACCGTGPFRGINSCGGRRKVKDYQLCQNPKDYVFFDSSHPSESTYKQSAELLWHGSPDVTAPHSLKSFFQLSG
ncbi:GDSL esterase/lipase 1-like [Nicotiana tabacum]|uniref:GDSL esterase/lipase 1-like n=2 Tax=Nicotiana TaxID=4085 RepID=A0A1S3YQQ6_TOBAC|nr:PREDICTED: GDSL esterase/lipase 1-like [Nicotiana sylvestris]XP_016454549.1 PREDICTED: GDSL esterase/lipase 1-like [Nicotiana tabacum]